MKDPKRPYNFDETVGIGTWNLCLNALNDVAKKLEQRITTEERTELAGMIDKLNEMFTSVFSRDPDPDHMAGLWRRMQCMKLHVGLTDKVSPEYIVLDVNDAQTLCGPALDKCDLECPCVTVDEETGERTVIREAVKACEMAKVYKRLMMRGNDTFAECPYSMLV